MIPVLDHGYIKLLSSSFPGDNLNQFFRNFSRSPSRSLARTVYLTLEIKAPLFVQLYLAEAGLTVVSKRPAQTSIEAYTPTLAEIGSPDLATNKTVADYFAQTTEALLLNQKAFEMDQCDKFVTQSLTPISSYNILVVSGSLIDWMPIVAAKGLPRPIEAYRQTIHEVMMGEWPNINETMRVLK